MYSINTHYRDLFGYLICMVSTIVYVHGCKNGSMKQIQYPIKTRLISQMVSGNEKKDGAKKRKYLNMSGQIFAINLNKNEISTKPIFS